MNMNTKQLQYVSVLAREGSFSRAAEVLGISQPSLSQYIKKMETELDIPLFVRTSSACRLTDAGRIFLETARSIAECERDMQNRLDDLRAERTGTITLGISPHRSVCLMPEIAAKFKRQYPLIRLVLCEKARAALLEGAERGEYDLCLTTPPVTPGEFTVTPVMREEILVTSPVCSESDKRFAALSHREAGREFPVLPISALDGEPFIYLPSGHPMQTILEALMGENAVTLPCAAECSGLETLFALARAGVASALVPSCLRHSSQGEETVHFYSLTPSLPYRDIILLTRPGQYFSEPLRTLIELITELK